MRQHLFGKYRTRPWSDAEIESRLEIGRLIHEARVRKDWTLGDLADRLEVTRQAVWEWEHLSNPSDLNLDELCVLLGLDYEQLMALKAVK